ncbi:MAG TPA: hypothetical protein VNW49_01475 [Puia sp.]|nr:hypothetical protein [Puia sp.]
MSKSIFSLAIPILFLSVECKSQGCLAIRNLAGFGQFAALGYKENKNEWMLDINNRYFHATQSFKGNKNVTPPDPSNGLSIYEYTMNFEISRILKNGWVLAMDLPFSANTISNKFEHGSGVYHTTSDFGVGDLRFTAYKWLLNINKPRKGNIQVGLGLKFPTGNYHSEDYFYYSKADPSLKMLAPVNPAIQLGDGGTGITTELNSFYIFNSSFSVYTNFFYLINPGDVNGVSNQFAGATPNPVSVATTADVNSIPDNYTLRAGVNYTYKLLVFTAGLRYEGAPAHDLFGNDDGLRRAGHIFSIEPGVEYKFKTSFLYSFVTIPISRGTYQTVPDQRATKITGNYTITGGDFASLILFVGYAFTF